MSGPVIAIDGPAGSGKSTIARMVAARLDVPHLDTGAMYRSVTWAVLDGGGDPTDADAAGAAAQAITIVIEDGRVTVDGRDVTSEIRGPEVTAAVSAVSSHPAVRSEMVRHQRDWIARAGGGVLDGRDIGTVVLPDADLKAYLTATPRTRARRRFAETPDSEFDLDAVEADIARRDELDSSREHSPLRPADDAVMIWTDDLGIDEVVDRVLAELRAAGYRPSS
ncbi:MAG: (d)CMP kinase [Actinomycetota bacterium]